ncbi:T9SS type A sorting domain-containing protein [Nonlabens ulvanivorans]|uniref:T9SS type A sorting domain-containing protein n=1 Tax=Nonlabens ulvanivorans TaxID=906888 RepID=UPI0037CC4A95
MRRLKLLIFLFSGFSIFAQNEGNFWYFGENAGLDFSTSPPTALSNSAMSTVAGCSTVSDSNGNLLFYTNGRLVWNRNHVLMSNSPSYGSTDTYSQQLIVKDPSSTNTYFILRTFWSDLVPGPALDYQIVDMSLDNGLGDIIPIQNYNHNVQFATQEKVSAFINSNGNSNWVVTTYFDYPTLRIYSIKIQNGIIDTSTRATSNFTSVPNYLLSGRDGILKISNDGTKLILTDGFKAALFDFNINTGVVTNPIRLSTNSIYNRFYGAEFSPDSSLLYINGNTDTSSLDCNTTNQRAVLQYDLSMPTGWEANPIVLNNSTLNNVRHGDLQLAQDGKIYASKNCQASLGAIQSPNVLGQGANYTDNAIMLAPGTTGRIGLPYLILPSQATASLTDNSSTVINMFPNPASSYINLTATNRLKSATIMDMNGRMLSQTNFTGNSTDQSISLENLSSGIYFVTIQSDLGQKVKKLVVE